MITGFYAALLTAYFVVVSVRVSMARNQTKVSIGDGGNAFLLQRIRVHGNFAEYIPFAVLLLALAEIYGLGTLWLHVAGIALVIGRLCMLYGLEYTSLLARVAGMACTYTPLCVLSGFLFFQYFTQL